MSALDDAPVLDACCGSRMFWFDKQDEPCRTFHPLLAALPQDIACGWSALPDRSDLMTNEQKIADIGELVAKLRAPSLTLSTSTREEAARALVNQQAQIAALEEDRRRWEIATNAALDVYRGGWVNG